MKIAILHLSDIHFHTGHNVLVNRYKKLFDAVKNELMPFDKIIILTSGDIANTGLEEEYKKATIFYDFLKENLEPYLKKQIQFVFVPGNHDCYFEKSKASTRGILLKYFVENNFRDIDENTLNILAEPQNHYFKFIEPYISNDTVQVKHKLLTVYDIPISTDNELLRVLAFNTSWDSQMDEEPGVKSFPLQLINDKLPFERAALTISVIHHPLNWQQPDSAKEFKEFLLNNTDFVLSGHEHSIGLTVIKDLIKKHNEVYFIESNPLQEKERPLLSSFNLMLIDTGTRNLEIKFLNLRDGVYEIKESSGQLNIEPKLSSNKLTFTESFLKDLDNPNASFKHSAVDEVKLFDIYISPDVNEITSKSVGKSKGISSLNSNSIFSEVTADSEIKCVFFGEDVSGKTLLWKYYYKKLYEKDLIPLFASGLKISDISPEKILKFFEEQFKKQYNSEKFVFNQLDFKKVVIFIDDFHLTPLTAKYKCVFLTNLGTYFNKIFIIGNDLMQLEAYTDSENNNTELFYNYHQFTILEFGYHLRYKLVQKWYHLGSDLTTDTNEILRKIDYAINNIDSIIVPNLIPSYPFFILTVLQTLEVDGSAKNEYNVPGFYYQYLITDALKDEISNPEEMGFYFKFLSEYSFHLFETKTRFNGVAIEYFKKFYENHCGIFDIDDFPFETAFNVLMSAKVLKIENDLVFFGYKYIYYFFTAQYFAENITDKNILSYIDLMSERLYREEYSNILIFLTHLSKDPFIINQLLEKSQTLFSEYEYLKLNSDVDFINKLQLALPKAIYESVDVEKVREVENLEKEKAEKVQLEEEYEKNKLGAFDYDINEDTSAIDVISRITTALRTLNILGLITKKYWGELRGEIKNKLAEETFKLGLRTIKFYFDLIESNQELIVSHLKTLIARKFMKKKVEKGNVDELSQQFIYNLCSVSIFGIIKRISNAIGYEKLNKTFETIEEQNPYNSIKLINTSIKLDHSDIFPWGKVTEMKKLGEKNFIVHSTIQNLVINYLYLYKTSVENKQRLCDMLGIAMADQRLIDATSVVKKEG